MTNNFSETVWTHPPSFSVEYHWLYQCFCIWISVVSAHPSRLPHLYTADNPFSVWILEGKCLATLPGPAHCCSLLWDIISFLQGPMISECLLLSLSLFLCFLKMQSASEESLSLSSPHSVVPDTGLLFVNENASMRLPFWVSPSWAAGAHICSDSSTFSTLICLSCSLWGWK